MEEKGKKKGKELRFSVFRWSEVISLRIKVDLLDESYELVSKTKEVGFSLTLVPLNLRAINGRGSAPIMGLSFRMLGLFLG